MSLKRFILQVADKGGAGKTHVTGAVLQYLLDNGVRARGIDPDSGNSTLYDTMPDAVTRLDIEDENKVPELDGMIGSLLNTCDTVVCDGMPGQRKRFLSWMEQIDLFAARRELGLDIIFLLVVEEDRDTIAQGVRILEQYCPMDVKWIVARNHPKLTHCQSWDRHAGAQELMREVQARVIDVPQLMPHLVTALLPLQTSVARAAVCDRVWTGAGARPDAWTPKVGWMDRSRLCRYIETLYREMDGARDILGIAEPQWGVPDRIGTVLV